MSTVHQMKLIETLPDGWEEWFCPQCCRRIRMRWQPYQKEVLDQGDIFAQHAGSKGGLQIGAVQVQVSDGMDVWREGLSDVDLSGV